MAETLVSIDHVSKRFCRRMEYAFRYALSDIWHDVFPSPGNPVLREGEFWALKDIDLTVKRGDVLGVVGSNGAGKSTLLNLISGLIRPTSGSVVMHTDRVALLDYAAGLNSVQSGRENILNKLAMLGQDPKGSGATVDRIIEFSGLGDFIDTPVGTYSSGMRTRLAFAIFTRAKPDLFIIDEGLGAGDVKFQARTMEYFRDFVARGGSALLATHSVYSLQGLCTRCVLLHQGKVHSIGDSDEIIHEYMELMNLAEDPSASAPASTPDRPAASEEEAAFLELFSNEDYSFPVTIEEVEIQAQQRSANGSIETLSSVEFVVRYSSEIDCESIAGGLVLGQAEFFPLAILSGGYDDVTFSLRKGRGELRCTVPQLPLLPGKYIVKAGILDMKTNKALGLKGYLDEPLSFTVSGPPNRGSRFAVSNQAKINIPVRWHPQS